tara:strand:- start:134 stop:484 length:351 start_codon:yes stop_codon:yes gene_type:complete
MTLLFKTISSIYLIVITLALLIPLDSNVVTLVIEDDKHPNNYVSFFIHFIIFFLLYVLFFISFIDKIKILIFCLTYAFLIEFLQIFFLRGFQIFDILFNLLGVIMSFLSIYYYSKK